MTADTPFSRDAGTGTASTGTASTGPASTAGTGTDPASTASTDTDPTDTGADPAVAMSRYRRIRTSIVTPQAIYGTLLVAAIIGTAADDEPDIEILITTVGTVIVFWLAHVFADGIAHYGTPKAVGLPMIASLKHSLHLASGLLYAAIVPCLFLFLGALHVLPETIAYAIALLLPVVLLGALGWFAFADRGSAWWVRLLGSIVTGLLGVFVIILKIAFH